MCIDSDLNATHQHVLKCELYISQTLLKLANVGVRIAHQIRSRLTNNDENMIITNWVVLSAYVYNCFEISYFDNIYNRRLWITFPYTFVLISDYRWQRLETTLQNSKHSCKYDIYRKRYSPSGIIPMTSFG